MSMENKTLIRYDGRYDWVEGDGRSYTIMSHTVVNGRDLYKCSFTGAQNLLAVLKGAL